VWVFSGTGFVSAVRKTDRPDVITVRSRDRKSLEPLATKASVEIKVSPYGDYPYRAFVEPAIFTQWVAEQADEIDYDNFKNKVAKTRGYDFVDALHNVWVAMLGAEGSSREELRRLEK
jgi:NADH dehydrogenase FAD-containing subunit